MYKFFILIPTRVKKQTALSGIFFDVKGKREDAIVFLQISIEKLDKNGFLVINFLC